MPLNTLRLNHQQSTHPNDRIVFIKPLVRPPGQKSDYDTAELILKAIAAQCLPIMKDHHLSVTTLEEYEPNPEFIGRNFNNGEIIQLVIRSKSGGWLPLNMIQMVMMHELAHNVHMNHSRNFWKTRNVFAEEMRLLWRKGYTGDGLWSQGRMLGDLHDAISGNTVPSEQLADLQICGGTFRSRRRKRKAPSGEELTWKEKRDRRIEKKFGKNGVALGEDEDQRMRLELTRKGPLGVKPRVAQSKRGRELRAAAALARFETNKKEAEELEGIKREEEDELAEDEDYDEIDADQKDALDIDGTRLVDEFGHGMIKVCEDENPDDVFVKQEMEDLENLDSLPSLLARDEGSDNKICSEPDKHTVKDPTQDNNGTKNNTYPQGQSPTTSNPQAELGRSASCPICSLTNDSLSTTCVACGHVLDAKKDPKSWHCSSTSCSGSSYLNSGDCGVCGVCGQKKFHEIK